MIGLNDPQIKNKPSKDTLHFPLLVSTLILPPTSYFLHVDICDLCRSQWPRGLRRRSSAIRLLRLCVRIPPGHVCRERCVLLGRGLCDGLITRPEESYRL
jgi:hypothetical protein